MDTYNKYTWEDTYGGTVWHDSDNIKTSLPLRFFATMVHNNEKVFVISEDTEIKDHGASWKVVKAAVYSAKSLRKIQPFYDPLEDKYCFLDLKKDKVVVYLTNIRDVCL